MVALKISAPDSNHSVLSSLVEAENGYCAQVFSTEFLGVRISVTAIPTR